MYYQCTLSDLYADVAGDPVATLTHADDYRLAACADIAGKFFDPVAMLHHSVNSLC